MNNERAIEVLETLLDGIDPETGEVLPEKGVHTEHEVVIALHRAVLALYRESGYNAFSNTLSARYYTKHGRLNAGRPWTENDDRQLKELFNRQVPIERMCTLLQRRTRGINNRLACLGFAARTTDLNSRPIKPGVDRRGTIWTPEEDARLEGMFNEEKPIGDMAKALHRSERGIKCRLERLQLIEDAENYPEESGVSTRRDNEDLKRRYLNGETVAQIASRYGIPEQAIRARLFYMGMIGNAPHVLPDRKKGD